MTRSPWLSWLLLTLVYLTYGHFLETTERPYAFYIALGSAVFAIAQAAFMTFLWKSSRNILLLGFQSDTGSFITVLLLASVTVLAVVQFHLFSYFLVMVSASLLARVDTLLMALNNQMAFLVLSFFPLLGLFLGWLSIFFVSAGSPGPAEPSAFLPM